MSVVVLCRILSLIGAGARSSTPRVCPFLWLVDKPKISRHPRYSQPSLLTADGIAPAILTPPPTERPRGPQHTARRDGTLYSDYDATTVYLDSDDESPSVEGEEFFLVRPTLQLSYHYV